MNETTREHDQGPPGVPVVDIPLDYPDGMRASAKAIAGYAIENMTNDDLPCLSKTLAVAEAMAECAAALEGRAR